MNYLVALGVTLYEAAEGSGQVLPHGGVASKPSSQGQQLPVESPPVGKRRHLKPPLEPRPSVELERPSSSAVWALVIASIAYVLLVLLSSTNPRPATWGIDASGYLSPHLRLPLLILLAIGAGLIVLAAIRSTVGSNQRKAERSREALNSRAIVIPWVFVALAGFWFLRVRNVFLGDQMVWSQNLRADQFPLYSEPLAAVIWRGYVLLLHTFRIAITDQSLALLPVLCGVAAAILAWRISECVVPAGTGRLLAFSLITTLGTAQLYAGYIESYAILSVAVLLYLLAGLRLARGEGSAVFLGVALALAISTHLLAMSLIPSYLILVFRSRSSALGRVSLLLVPILTAIGVGWLIGVEPTDLAQPFGTLRVAVLSALRGTGQATPIGLLVSRPLVELGNLVLLVMPVPTLLLASHLMSRTRGKSQSGRHVRRYLLWAAVPGILAAAVLVLPGSPAQDWDLLSIAVLPAALLGIYVGLVPKRSTPSAGLAFGLTSLALAPLLAFLLVNADENTGTRRFKTIIDPSTIISAHERAYANEKLVKYYTARKEFDLVFVYAQRAHAAEPGNTRYWGNVGTALYNLRRYEEAARYFEEARKQGSDRPEVYYNLGLCYMRAGRFAEAAKDIRIAINIAGEQPKYLNSLGLALLGAGDPSGAYSVLSYVRKQWPDFEPTARAFEYYFGERGLRPPDATHR